MKRKRNLWLIIVLFLVVPAKTSIAYEAEDVIIISEDDEREENSTEKETELNASTSDMLETDTTEIETEQLENDDFILLIEEAESASPAAISTTLASGTCGENLTWELSDDGVMTISGTGDMTEWNYYSVMPWNDYLNDIESVIISDGVTSIGFGAFRKCVNLTNVSIPVSVTTIDWYAFSDCASLTEITIPSGVTTLGAWVFYNCTGLTDVTIPATVTSMLHAVFWDCTSLKSATILASVTELGSDTFYGCTSLTDVSLPSSLTEIDGDAFRGCSSLVSIILPSEVTRISSGAFYDCVSLVSITIPSKVTTIYRNVFYCCSSLKSITLPASLKAIGDRTFSGCTSLADVYYGDSESKWSEIDIGTDNTCLTEATIHYGFSLVLNANGGSVSPESMTVTRGLSYGSLPTPTRSGYTFLGWYTAVSGGSQVTSSTMVSATSAQTLYAHWTANSYTVSFNANGGSTSTGSKIVTYASTYGTLPTPARSGYNFLGWYTSSTGGTQVTGSTTVNITSAQTLYAHWVKPTKKQTISASSSVTKTYVQNGTFNLNATAVGSMTYTSSNKNVATVSSSGKITMKGYGTAKIKITAAASGAYKKATKTITVTIKPAKMTLSSVKSSSSKTMTIKWKSDTKASGYQVQVSTSKKFTSGTTMSKSTSNVKNKKVTLKNLNKGKKYYVRIRAYKTVNGKKVYGTWSTVKSATVK